MESKLHRDSRQKEETRQTMAFYWHMETNRREKNGETEDYPVHRRATKAGAKCKLQYIEQKSKEKCQRRQMTILRNFDK